MTNDNIIELLVKELNKWTAIECYYSGVFDYEVGYGFPVFDFCTVD